MMVCLCRYQRTNDSNVPAIMALGEDHRGGDGSDVRVEMARRQ
jgi:hypothetical protein